MSSSASAPGAELAQLDLGVLDQLGELQAALEQVDQRLKAMEQKKDAVAEEVYNRVRRDYVGQRQKLLQDAEPLRQQVRSLYARVQATLLQLEQEFQSVRMDLEEIEFRHALGEFDAEEKARRSESRAKLLKQRESARDEALALRARFAKALPGLEAAPEAAVATLAESEDPTQRVKPVSEDEIRTAELPTPEEAGRPAAPVAPPAAPSPPAAPPPPPRAAEPAPPRRNPDATVVFRPARLSDESDNPAGGPYTLGLKPLSIGSDPRCDVKVEGVAARQAEVGPSRSGFILRDLAGGLTQVNGQSVDELLLKDGDLIELKQLRLRFSQV